MQEDVALDRGQDAAEDLKKAARRILGMPEDGGGETPTSVQLMAMIDRQKRYYRQFDRPREDPMHEIRSRLGDRWSVMILVVLRTGAFRPAVLGRLVSLISVEEKQISARVLTFHLRQLERDGLVRRTVLSPSPLSVEYGITALGTDLLTVWDTLRDWTFAHSDEIRAAQGAFDRLRAETEGW
jgi:DNA-binding HxlR family transcriptional regulator